MKKTGLARHTVLARLHHLRGQDKVGIRQINMAKVHTWKDMPDEKELEETLGKKQEIKKKIEVAPLEEKHIKTPEKPVVKKSLVDMEQIKKDIAEDLKVTHLEKHKQEIVEESGAIKKVIGEDKKPKKILDKDHILTGVPGFDGLLDEGIPKGVSVLVAGGAGSGKTIFCLQTLAHQASK